MYQFSRPQGKAEMPMKIERNVRLLSGRTYWD